MKEDLKTRIKNINKNLGVKYSFICNKVNVDHSNFSNWLNKDKQLLNERALKDIDKLIKKFEKIKLE